MAEKPKKLRVRVVSIYGGHIPGENIEVDEREYNRLRIALEGGEFRYPVLISAADAEVLAKKEQAEREAQMKKALTENDHGKGWAALEEQSLAIVRAKHAEREAQTRAEQDRIVAEHRAGQQ